MLDRYLKKSKVKKLQTPLSFISVLKNLCKIYSRVYNSFYRQVSLRIFKAFDCFHHGLLMVKLHANGFSKNSMTFFYFCLKKHKQNIKINNTQTLQITFFWSVARFHTGSNPFQHFFLTICFFGYALLMCKILENPSQCAVKWFTNNCIILNLGKFQSIILERSKGKILIINSNSFEISESVKLLGREIDNYESYVPAICKRAAGQLNAFSG